VKRWGEGGDGVGVLRGCRIRSVAAEGSRATVDENRGGGGRLVVIRLLWGNNVGRGRVWGE